MSRRRNELFYRLDTYPVFYSKRKKQKNEAIQDPLSYRIRNLPEAFHFPEPFNYLRYGPKLRKINSGRYSVSISRPIAPSTKPSTQHIKINIFNKLTEFMAC